MNACVWALGRALAYATATAIAAIVIASLVSGADAERFATTAYVAALVAALILAVKWFLRDAPVSGVSRPRGAIFPAAFTFTSGVGALLLLGAAFASQPGSELLAVAACFGLVVAAALVRGGAILSVNAKLLHGDRLSVATRYAVVAAVVALAARALLSSNVGEGFVRLAYAAMVIATVAIAASLIAPTAAGATLRRGYARASSALRAPQSPRVFARMAQYAVATAVAGLILASLLPEAYAERFTTTAYLATIFAALGIGMTWRLRNGASGGPDEASGARWPRFALAVAALLVAGSALSFSPVTEGLAVCACLYLIGAAILKATSEEVAAA
ncbi:MAG TPA: hypothetical protein VMT95_06970 [Candidatus Binatia bacterium]|nr:hypothetical protein [Candidatus Binatia bacterium]